MTSLDSSLQKAAEDVHDGWYADEQRIDWHDFIDRLELHTEMDLGSDMGSPLIASVQRHIRSYRNQ